MARSRFALAAVVAVACALPKVEVDPALDKDAGASAGTATTKGGGAGTSAATAGTGGSTNLGGSGPGQAGAMDDTRESLCGDYCTTYLQNCLNSPANTYDNLDDCLNTCFNSDWPIGADDTVKNSIRCRDLHAHLARDLPNPHCFHSAEVPSGSFCAL
jgi:hypothetical protein